MLLLIGAKICSHKNNTLGYMNLVFQNSLSYLDIICMLLGGQITFSHKFCQAMWPSSSKFKHQPMIEATELQYKGQGKK